MQIERTRKEILEKCPSCDHEYKPRKQRKALQCPKCKSIYVNAVNIS